jgi:hypothetical protein
LKFFENFKFYENFEILWQFWIFLKFLKFWNFFKISEFSLIDDEVRVFRINIKLLSNPVAELKIRENDSHCRSIVLKTMDHSIVKQLEKEKNSNFNVENFVVMLTDRSIYCHMTLSAMNYLLYILVSRFLSCRSRICAWLFCPSDFTLDV